MDIDEYINKLSIEIDSLNKNHSKNNYNKNGLEKKIKDALNEIEENRNHSLAVELYKKNKYNLDKIALKYRGTKITYRELFQKSYEFAKSLKKLGFTKGSEIPICITNTPEFIYIFLATSFIGAKVNCIGEWFDTDYLIEILNKTKSKTIFISDISYEALKLAIEKSNIESIVCLTLFDSLKNNVNPYQEIDNLFNNFQNCFSQVKSDYKGECLNLQEFINIGMDYSGNIVEESDLDDVCSITYTSGTTNPTCPKGVMQSNRSYITLSRFKESDVSGMPTMKNMSVLAHIPTSTHMELSCAISDTLYCGCQLDLEPFYSKDFFPYSLLINKSNFVPASAGFWGNLCKKLAYDPLFENTNMPFLMIPTVTGEGMSEGEEKFFNQISKKHKFGVDKLPFPLAPVTFSIGGGTTESSGIFVTLYKSLQEKRPRHIFKKEKLGLTPHKFSDIQVLDEKGHYCDINQPGLLVANSPCEMIGYTDNNLNAHVVDAKGKKWLSLGTYSYKDSTGRIKMKGRMGNFVKIFDGTVIPFYKIEDTILKDTKNVMSCAVVKSVNDELVCHIELQPFKQKSETESYRGIIGRVESYLPQEIKDILYIRLRDNIESFPLDPSGKRSLSTLIKQGVDEKTLAYNEFKNNYTSKNSINKPKILTLK